MVVLKTNEELEKDIKFTLVLYFLFWIVGVLLLIVSVWFIQALPIGILGMLLAIGFDIQRNADLIRIELRVKQ